MFKQIQSFLSSIIPSSGPHQKTGATEDIRFSVAILLVEIMHADHVLHEHEQSLVIRLLEQQFVLDEFAATALFKSANDKMKDAVSLHEYTSRLNSELSYPQKFQLMTNLWKVVYADGQVDRYEEHLIRRMADLIHVSHKDFIRSKHLAEESTVC